MKSASRSAGSRGKAAVPREEEPVLAGSGRAGATAAPGRVGAKEKAAVARERELVRGTRCLPLQGVDGSGRAGATAAAGWAGAKGKAVVRSRSGKPLDPLTAAVQFLARGDRSTHRVTAFLGSRGYSPTAIRATRRTLERLGYLNDDVTAVRLAEAQLRRRPMGRNALFHFLWTRDFPHAVVDRAVRKAYNNNTEEAVAVRFLSTIPVRFNDASREARRREALLARRGFSEDLIEALLLSGFPDQGQS